MKNDKFNIIVDVDVNEYVFQTLLDRDKVYIDTIDRDLLLAKFKSKPLL